MGQVIGPTIVDISAHSIIVSTAILTPSIRTLTAPVRIGPQHPRAVFRIVRDHLGRRVLELILKPKRHNGQFRAHSLDKIRLGKGCASHGA